MTITVTARANMVWRAPSMLVRVDMTAGIAMTAALLIWTMWH